MSDITPQSWIKHGTGQSPTPFENDKSELAASDWLAAIQLLKESRECIAACFRTIAASDDKMIMDRLEMELALAGVENGIGVRLQNFIAANEPSSPTGSAPETV